MAEPETLVEGRTIGPTAPRAREPTESVETAAAAADLPGSLRGRAHFLIQTCVASAMRGTRPHRSPPIEDTPEAQEADAYIANLGPKTDAFEGEIKALREQYGGGSTYHAQLRSAVTKRVDEGPGLWTVGDKLIQKTENRYADLKPPTDASCRRFDTFCRVLQLAHPDDTLLHYRQIVKADPVAGELARSVLERYQHKPPSHWRGMEKHLAAALDETPPCASAERFRQAREWAYHARRRLRGAVTAYQLAGVTEVETDL